MEFLKCEVDTEDLIAVIKVQSWAGEWDVDEVIPQPAGRATIIFRRTLTVKRELYPVIVARQLG